MNTLILLLALSSPADKPFALPPSLHAAAGELWRSMPTDTKEQRADREAARKIWAREVIKQRAADKAAQRHIRAQQNQQAIARLRQLDNMQIMQQLNYGIRSIPKYRYGP